jgi:hypothetical protein
MTMIVEKFKIKIEERRVEERANNNVLYKKFFTLANSRFFDILISVSIICNTILLGLDKHPQGKTEELVIEYINLVFYAVFFFEMITKITGFGFRSYFRNYSNAFDFVIVLLSTVDVVIFALPADQNTQDSDSAMQRLGTVS